MGCAHSKQVAATPPAHNAPQPQEQHLPLDHTDDPVAALDFELSAPMLVMPFATFKRQGRIFKSVKSWRDAALVDGRLVVYVKDARDIPAPGRVVIFISHTWWDREFLDPNRDPDDPYDKGAPDYQQDFPVDGFHTYQRPKDLKWRIICNGVDRLCEAKGLKVEDVLLWVDWQSVSQACTHPSVPAQPRPRPRHQRQPPRLRRMTPPRS